MGTATGNPGIGTLGGGGDGQSWNRMVILYKGSKNPTPVVPPVVWGKILEGFSIETYVKRPWFVQKVTCAGRPHTNSGLQHRARARLGHEIVI